MTESVPRRTSWRASFLHRELLLLIVLACAAVVAFAATRAIAESNAELRRRDATAWRDRGHQALSAGDIPVALAALRRGAHISPADRDIAVALATALGASGDEAQAAEVLEALRDTRPDDVEVNTELARLEARRGDLPLAIRYYQDALDALWAPAAAERGRTLRKEFIELLMRHGQRARALAQTLVLAADLPPDPQWLIDVGRLFLQAGDPRRALDRFAAVLSSDPGNERALAGAGEAAFDLGEYAGARRYLAAASVTDPRALDIRDVADLVLSVDPLAPRLSRSERDGRIERVLAHATARMDTCANAAVDRDPAREQLRKELSSLASMPKGPRAAAADRDRAEEVLTVAARVQTVTAGCARGDSFDRAIPLIARARGLEESR